MGYAFISYSSKNKILADSMRDILNKNNIATWMAPYDIPTGSEYADVLYDALLNCSCLVLMITDVSQNSKWVKKEVNIAVSNSKPIVPIKLEDIELNNSMKLYLNDQQMEFVPYIDENLLEVQKIIRSIITIVEGASHKESEKTHKEPLFTQYKYRCKNIDLTVWSPVNTEVYLNDKNHLIMRIDHNTGFDYKHNSISVSGDFSLIFVSKGFEKKISFEVSNVDNKLEYHLEAILSKKEIFAAYDREDAINQLELEPTGYAFEQLKVVGVEQDVDFLIEIIKKLSSKKGKTHNTNYLIAVCASTLCGLAVKFNRIKDIAFLLELYKNYQAKSSYGYMFDDILKVIADEV